MIFYFNASGSSIGMSPERVYQGSNKANKVYVVCPIPKSAVVSVTYDLPNGDKSASFIMNSVMLENHKEMVDKYGITFNMWEVDLEEIASAYCGCVGVQFTFALSSGEILNSSYQRFYVERGVNVLEPEQTDTYHEILAFLSNINARLLEVERVSEENKLILEPMVDDVEMLKTKTEIQGQTLTENIGDIRSLYSSVGGANQGVLNNSISIQGLSEKLEFVSSVISETIIGDAEISDSFLDRKTANGLSVINGTSSQIVKIEGDTVEGDDGNFADAIFYGIESHGANIFNTSRANITQGENYTVVTNNEESTVCINGIAPLNQTVVSIPTGMDAGKVYSVRFEHLGGNAIDSLGNEVTSPIRVFAIDGTFDYCVMTNEETPFGCDIVGSKGKKVFVNLIVNNAKDIIFNDYKFRAMVVEGGYTSSNMLKFKPYVSPETYNLTESVSLGKYDYLDVESGRIVRQTGYVVKETPFTEEEIALYPGATVSSDGMKLFYKLQDVTSYSLSMPKEYVVYNGGREKLVFQDGEGSSNAIVTIRQKYLIKLGV